METKRSYSDIREKSAAFAEQATLREGVAKMALEASAGRARVGEGGISCAEGER